MEAAPPKVIQTSENSGVTNAKLGGEASSVTLMLVAEVREPAAPLTVTT
jgi:hypothetical protein